MRNLPPDFQWFGYTQDAGQWIIVVDRRFWCSLRLPGECDTWRAGRAVYAVGSDAEAARFWRGFGRGEWCSRCSC